MDVSFRGSATYLRGEFLLICIYVLGIYGRGCVILTDSYGPKGVIPCNFSSIFEVFMDIGVSDQELATSLRGE